MPVTFRIQGLERLQEDLRNLPEELRGEATNLIEAEANAAAVAIRRVYAEHIVSGRLVESLTVERERGSRFGVSYKVHSSDPIAWLFDNGSQARHWATGKSTGAMWGKTAPTHIFVKSMMAARRNLALKLAWLLVRSGLAVRGDYFDAAA